MTHLALTVSEIRELLLPYVVSGAIRGSLDEDRLAPTVELTTFCQGVSTHLELLLRWNERMNLTSVRDPREVVLRHFGESFFAAQQLSGVGSLLDLGSGAGFPGIPIQLWNPGLRVTLAESQAKKASFLREVVRNLSLGTEVWGDRADLLDGGFDAVVMRSVDRSADAILTAAGLALSELWVMGSAGSVSLVPAGFSVVAETRIPGGGASLLVQMTRGGVG